MIVLYVITISNVDLESIWNQDRYYRRYILLENIKKYRI